MAKKEAEHHNFDTSEVRFVIDGYEDIFSEFDPRPVERRGLSDDFLFEAKRACTVKEDEVDFIFLVPKDKRDAKKEAKIAERLRNHFNKHHGILRARKKKMLSLGWAFTIIGVILMFAAAWLFFKYRETSFITSFFTILLEPASWFLFWEGLDQVIFEAKKINPELDSYKKMANAKISFVSSN